MYIRTKQVVLTNNLHGTAVLQTLFLLFVERSGVMQDGNYVYPTVDVKDFSAEQINQIIKPLLDKKLIQEVDGFYTLTEVEGTEYLQKILTDKEQFLKTYKVFEAVDPNTLGFGQETLMSSIDWEGYTQKNEEYYRTVNSYYDCRFAVAMYKGIDIVPLVALNQYEIFAPDLLNSVDIASYLTHERVLVDIEGIINTLFPWESCSGVSRDDQEFDNLTDDQLIMAEAVMDKLIKNGFDLAKKLDSHSNKLYAAYEKSLAEVQEVVDEDAEDEYEDVVTTRTTTTTTEVPEYDYNPIIPLLWWNTLYY